jgi:uncharacterized protein YijF (DUF1287 family)
MPYPARLLVLLAVVAIALSLALFARSHAYRGPLTEAPSWDPHTDPARIVEEARKLTGILYDPIQGYFHNIGGRLGFIVCMDVPVLAYSNAGSSIKRLLETDYAAHPEYYGKKDGRPGDPYFHRRARNLYSYCKANACLHMEGPPRPADVVFMSRSKDGWITHIALVTEVSPDGGYKVVEASRDEWYLTREEPAERMFRRGWLFRGFGRPLG